MELSNHQMARQRVNGCLDSLLLNSSLTSAMTFLMHSAMDLLLANLGKVVDLAILMVEVTSLPILQSPVWHITQDASAMKRSLVVVLEVIVWWSQVSLEPLIESYLNAWLR